MGLALVASVCIGVGPRIGEGSADRSRPSGQNVLGWTRNGVPLLDLVAGGRASSRGGTPDLSLVDLRGPTSYVSVMLRR